MGWQFIIKVIALVTYHGIIIVFFKNANPAKYAKIVMSITLW